MFTKTVVAATAAAFLTSAASAAPVDVDIMFVIDQSGSMSDEFTTLSNNISTFVNGLAGDANVSSLGIGLVTYEDASQGAVSCSGGDPNRPCLKLWNSVSTSSDLTGLQSSLGTAAANVFGGTEDGLTAVDSVLPGGTLFQAAGWRNNTVKSVVLITDEGSNDLFSYSNSYGTGAAALGAKLDAVGYLNNIITSSFYFDGYEPMSRPDDAVGDGNYESLFDITNFTGFGADPAAFLAQFAAAKLQEITTGGTTTSGSSSVVPLPAAGWMLLAGVGGLAALRRKGEKSA